MATRIAKMRYLINSASTLRPRPKGHVVKGPLIASIILGMALLAPLLASAQAMIQDARIWTDPEKTRLVFDLSAPFVHRIFALDHPDRLIVDIDDARLDGTLKLPAADPLDANVTGLRGGMREKSHARVVVDLKQPVRAKSFALSPNERYGYRLVIDLTPRDGSHLRRVAVPSLPHARAARAPKGQADPRGGSMGVVVAIDAGHGGEDPGAIGGAGTKEKDITLAIARELARLIEREPGLRPVMIRDGDYYVGLAQRIEIARAQHADLLVSIHADAFTDPAARGSSVFTLSQGGASSRAANWLADRENRADQVGGVDQPIGDDLLTTILMDLTQNATFEHSHEVADLVLAKLRRVGTVHSVNVQRANFAVLRALDIPSILVETAFISNAEDEQRLRDPAYQRAMAEAIHAGIHAYFRKYPPPGLLLAEAARATSAPSGAPRPAGGGREYVISPGDTLSAIAKRHRVSVAALRAHNGLEGDLIRVGDVLTIPEDS